MSRLRFGLAFVLLAGAAALGACSKTGSPPGGFGVNITVDATMVPSAQRAMITTDKLTVVSDAAGSTPVIRMLDDLPKAIAGGTVRFHYTPGTGVSAGDKLSFGLDVMNGSARIASGSATVTLETGAVSLTIALASGGNDGGLGADGGKGNGTACVTDDECGSGFCADGVCCNEKCDDVCVSCKLSTSKGTCTPYAADTDPEMECAANLGTMPPASDGGMTTAEAGASSEAGTEAGAEASSADASSADASTDADESDLVVINQPDGGFMTMPNACAGTCGGARACKYPGATTTCGKPFCNSRGDVGTFVCDGNGSCAPTLASCTNFSCDDSMGNCGTSCSGPLDCLAGKYCDGTTHKCVQKDANGLTCVTNDECASGYCVGGVCCNTSCNPMQGLSCNDPMGTAGQCKCPGVTCGAGVACQVFYQDADGDGFGNRDGVVGTTTTPSLTAKAGCMGSPPPAGYVADNTDCDDGDPNAHPNQTAYFATPTLGKHNFDYDCNGTNETETPQYVSCKFCGAVGSCSSTTGVCSSAGETGSFQCPQEGIYRIPIGPIEPIATGGKATTFATTPTPSIQGPPPLSSRVEPIIPIRSACCGCAASDKTGFLTAVACGTTGTTYTCSACGAVGGSTAPGTPTVKVQRCR
jgi:hypothetical protein